jgi:MFS family permease
MQSDSPWQISSFRRLFAASAVSQLGTSVSYVAVPLVAVITLNASPGQVGVLATLSTVAFLLIGLPAGAWVDRMSHRRLLIAADLTRSALFASVTLAWGLHVLTLELLYVVVLLNGCATVFFDVGSQSILPQLVGRGSLVQANAAIGSLQAGGIVVGRGAGGVLVQLLTAPVAVICTAVSYLASGLRLIGIPRTQKPTPSGRHPVRLRAEVTQGLRHVFGSRQLRDLAFIGLVTNLGTQIINTMLPVLFTRQLGLPASALGLFWAVGGAGILLGVLCANPIARRLGHGRTLGIVGLYLAPAGLLVPFISKGPLIWLAGAGWALAMFKTGVLNVIGISLRQLQTPDALLGRMNATFRFMLYGALSIGSATAGLIGEFASVRTALWVGSICLAVAFFPVFFSSPLKRYKLPERGRAAELSAG